MYKKNKQITFFFFLLKINYQFKWDFSPFERELAAGAAQVDGGHPQVRDALLTAQQQFWRWQANADLTTTLTRIVVSLVNWQLERDLPLRCVRANCHVLGVCLLGEQLHVRFAN